VLSVSDFSCMSRSTRPRRRPMHDAPGFFHVTRLEEERGVALRAAAFSLGDRIPRRLEHPIDDLPRVRRRAAFLDTCGDEAHPIGTDPREDRVCSMNSTHEVGPVQRVSCAAAAMGMARSLLKDAASRSAPTSPRRHGQSQLVQSRPVASVGLQRREMLCEVQQAVRIHVIPVYTEQ